MTNPCNRCGRLADECDCYEAPPEGYGSDEYNTWYDEDEDYEAEEERCARDFGTFGDLA
jgi:hypothetical protein